MADPADDPDESTRLGPGTLGAADTGDHGQRTTSADSATLAPGTRLHEFELLGLVGEGGFGVVYKARDTQLQRIVAIKEYMPGSMSVRRPDGQVTLRSERHRETFEIGLRSFLKEAREMAAFDHPALVKVYRFWEANGTAYMVMPFLEGRTLKAHLAREGPPSEAWLMALLHPVADALEQLHARHCYHRDIAPDNIMLMGPPEAPSPMLLDFGAARRVLDDSTQALTVILKPGYAPLEQYAEVASLRQGPWTDIYALCATLYAAITGSAPPPAVARVVTDEWVPARQRGAGRYSEALLGAIDAGLAVRPEHRPQSLQAWRAMLPREAPIRTDPEPAFTVSRTPREQDVATQLAPGAGTDERTSQQHPKRSPDGSPQTARSVSRVGLWAGAAVLSAAVLAAAWFWGTRQAGAPNPEAAASPSAPSTTAGTGTAAMATAPAQPDRPAGTAPAPGRAAVPAPSPPAPAAPAAAPAAHVFSVSQAFADAIAGSDAGSSLKLGSPKTRLVIGRDQLALDLSSTLGGHVYLLLADAARQEVLMLFPNGIDGNNRIAAGGSLRLPRRNWEFTVGGPPGTHTVLAIVSAAPRNFKAAGLLKGSGDLQQLDLQAWERRWISTAHPAGFSQWLPPVACPGTAPCDERFAAALLDLQEVQR
jgi:serine/threonine protein kinase